MQLIRSIRVVLLGALLLLATPGTSAAQWVFGGGVEYLGFAFPLDGPVIYGFHSDGAATLGLPGTWPPGGFLGISGEELAVAPTVTSFTQTLTTPAQYTSTLTLGANYATAGTVFTLGIDQMQIELAQTNLGGPPTPARALFFLVIPWQYNTNPPFVTLSGTYSFNITSTKATLGTADFIRVESCTMPNRYSFLEDVIAGDCVNGDGILHGAFAAGNGTSMPIPFVGTISGVVASNTRHTFTALFDLRIENGTPPETITLSDFEFEMIATPSAGAPALSVPARALLVSMLIGTVATGSALYQRRRPPT